MTQALNLAALARQLSTGGMVPPAAVSSLSASLSATGTDMVINGLDADTLYEGTAFFTAALDGAVVDIRFLNVTAANGLGAGSRVILRRLL